MEVKYAAADLEFESVNFSVLIKSTALVVWQASPDFETALLQSSQCAHCFLRLWVRIPMAA